MFQITKGKDLPGLTTTMLYSVLGNEIIHLYLLKTYDYNVLNVHIRVHFVTDLSIIFLT